MNSLWGIIQPPGTAVKQGVKDNLNESNSFELLNIIIHCLQLYACVLSFKASLLRSYLGFLV